MTSRWSFGHADTIEGTFTQPSTHTLIVETLARIRSHLPLPPPLSIWRFLSENTGLHGLSQRSDAEATPFQRALQVAGITPHRVVSGVA